MGLGARSGRELRRLDVRCDRDTVHHLVLRTRVQALLRTGFVLSLDAAAVAVTGATAKLVFAIAPASSARLPDTTIAALGYALVLGLAAAGAYRAREFRSDPLRIVGAWALAAGGGLAVSVVGGAWDLWPASLLLVTAALLVVLGCRLMADRVVVQLHSSGILRERAVIVGDPGILPVARAHVQQVRAQSVQVQGCVGVASEEWGADGSAAELETFLRAHPVDVVVVAGLVPSGVLREVMTTSFRRGARLELIPAFDPGAEFRWVPQAGPGGPVVEARPMHLGVPQMAVKRALDVAVAGLGLLLLSPLLCVIAAAIRLDSPGPIFFGQTRVGVGGEAFRMWKFRTMVRDADQLKPALASLNETGDPRLFKVAADPRVTRVGRWLRRTSLDEMPQLFNVLRGEMSLVGPRPFFPEDLELYEPHHYERLSVLPGITGLWQVSGRSEIRDFDSVVQLDLEYIRRWSVRLDLAILARTIPAVFRRQGAY